ncbi:hypothetical protein LHK_01118 [Laribacter hongkongensis HLHK9]|uniref:Uncharacterized protein n=1 Tax=Laribacter hongkongensis (strain HLHK9) TaxID=557598 RepID=C1D6K3_LARHH|nr:hypothetical protein LHK_01118 [Laribacter hongkongensis HLHK9]
MLFFLFVLFGLNVFVVILGKYVDVLYDFWFLDILFKLFDNCQKMFTTHWHVVCL